MKASWGDDDTRLGWALAWGGCLGGACFYDALESGALAAAWAGGAAELQRFFPQHAKALAHRRRGVDASALGAKSRRSFARWVVWGDKDYPEAWAIGLGSHAPAAFQVQGVWPPQAPVVAVVGTRKASSVGLRLAERMGQGLCAAGVGVASGLAAGVDGAAHQGALLGGGPTWAFLGSGLDHRYPQAHEPLAQAILDAGGALLSPWAPDAPPLPWRFLARNELLASLALGTVVVEAPLRSGAIHSAGVAARCGREVLAVPGCVEWPNAAGCNALLRDGAIPVVNAQQVLESLGLQGVMAHQPQSTSSATPTGPTHPGDRAVWEALQGGVHQLDELPQRCGLELSTLLITLGRLEAQGHLRRTLWGYEALA